jgi:hypothetical protein
VLQLFQWIHETTRNICRVLKAHQSSAAVMLVSNARLSGQIVDAQHSLRRAKLTNGDAAEHCGTTGLEDADMAGIIDQQFVTRQTINTDSHLVRLCSRAGKYRSLFSQHFRKRRLQAIDSRVFAQHVVTDFGIEHCLFHR